MKKLLYTLLAVSIIFSACEEEDTAPANTNNNGNNNNTGNNTNLQLGDFHEGGIIFWLDVGGSTGLVVSYEDMNDTYGNSVLHNWCGPEHHDGGYNVWLNDVANSTGFGSGMENTTEIVNANLQSGSGSPNNAAEICYYSTFQGYTDWYLPSKDELNQIYLRKDIIESASGVVPFSECYWSSSASQWQYTSFYDGTGYFTVRPWAQYFLFTNQYQAGQAVNENSEELLSVRAIRAF